MLPNNFSTFARGEEIASERCSYTYPNSNIGGARGGSDQDTWVGHLSTAHVPLSVSAPRTFVRYFPVSVI